MLHFRLLGDSKPSALMDEMLALLSDHTPCLLFEQLFLKRLPDDIRIQLVDGKIEDYRALARRVDDLWSSRDMEPLTVSAVQRRPLATRQQTISGTSRFDTPDSNRLCYYHLTFGEAARQCKQPCNWSGNGKAVASGRGGRP